VTRARCLASTLIAVLALANAADAQTPAPARSPAPPPRPFRITIDAAALAGLPRVTIAATDEGGHTNQYSGVSLHDLLVRAGAPNGMAIRGTAMLSYLVVGASDGYRVIFALPELDPGFTDHVALLAETRDGAPLPAGAGPYRLIVPFEKREARWVRGVTDIELVNAPAP
jgi:hypothetical protein